MVWKLGCLVVVLLAVHYCEAEVNCNEDPKFKSGKDCCQKPEITKNEPIEEECKELAKQSEQGGRGPRHGGVCQTECVFNASKMLVNGEFQADAVKPFVESTVVDPDFQDVFQNAFIKCAAEAKEFMSDHPPPPPRDNDNGPKCSFYATAIMHCVFKESFINCPDKFAEKSDNCNNMREYMQTCPMGPHGRHRRGRGPPPDKK